MNKEKKFEKPKYEIIKFAAEDVIATSVGGGTGTDTETKKHDLFSLNAYDFDKQNKLI